MEIITIIILTIFTWLMGIVVGIVWGRAFEINKQLKARING